ncbi:alpha/beta fold hydrolase [Hymenobacter sp. BT730]|uniref:alpha/beta fold hydrolase n=1 Tax=Hymenobacter sp. BT730 TaxID=3063332 RepID=UPI0026E0F7A6|nr:alpha/beta hydrolase [Hymenobacter sp. BT730]
MPAPTTAQPLTVPLPDGRQLGLTRYGNPAHPAVIFHHGYASSGIAVPECTAELARLGLQIMAPDRPGSGLSDVDENLTLESFAADVLYAVDALQIPGPLAVAGWSGGGVHALALAALYPERVATVQLLSTALPFGDEEAYAELHLRWKAARFVNDYLPILGKVALVELSAQWQQKPDKMIDSLLGLLGPTEQAVKDQPAHRALLRDAAVHGFANQGQGVYFDGRALCQPPAFQLEAIQASTTIWHGTEDSVWPPDNLDFLAENIPEARLQLLPGEGHMLYLNHWEAILQRVRAEMK